MYENYEDLTLFPLKAHSATGCSLRRPTEHVLDQDMDSGLAGMHLSLCSYQYYIITSFIFIQLLCVQVNDQM